MPRMSETQRTTLDYNRMLPYIIARALTLVAKDAQAEVVREMPQRFDRPTPFTLNALRVKPATARDHTAQVFVKDMPGGKKHYLLLQEFGGVRVPAQAQTLALPWGKGKPSIRLNAYGNAPRGIAKALLQEKYQPAGAEGGDYGGGVFSGVPRGRTADKAGIWRRPKRKAAKKGKRKGQITNRRQPLRMLLGYERQATFRPLWRYHETVKRVVQQRYFGRFRESVGAVSARFIRRSAEKAGR